MLESIGKNSWVGDVDGFCLNFNFEFVIFFSWLD